MILTFIEVRNGKIKKASLEALSEAARLAPKLQAESAAVLAGAAAEALAPEVFSYGAAKVYLLENQVLDRYSAQTYAAALGTLIEKVKPKAVFFAATSMGKDLAPRLAARLDAALASDCTGVTAPDGRLEFTRPIFAGKALLTLALTSEPQLATFRPNVFPAVAAGGATGELIRTKPDLPAFRSEARVDEILEERGGELDVSEADIIISGGRGLKAPENFELLRKLSALLPRSAVGASRSAVDSGWIGHQHQVGQTGKTVCPNLYLAFGISGAIQHVAGMSSSKVIVAVNKDPDAPIFRLADFGVVGDLFQVIPALLEEIKKVRSD